MEIHKLLIICPLVFFAGLVDAVAGGGGVISLTAYVATGIPFHMALGTNKFSSTFAGLTATTRYLLSGNMEVKIAGISAMFALFGSWLGASAAMLVSTVFLKYFMLGATPLIAVIVLVKKNFGAAERETGYSQLKVIVIASLISVVVGFYDGFYGPGTGTFLIIGFTAVLGRKLIVASANAKLINLASNVAALITFAFNGQIAFQFGIPAAICGIAGGYVGSGLAIKNGSKFIRPMFILVLVLIMLYILNQLTGFIVFDNL